MRIVSTPGQSESSSAAPDRTNAAAAVVIRARS